MRRLILQCLAIVAVVALTACASPSHIRFIPDGPSYTDESLSTALEAADPGAAASVSADSAPEVRQKALASLRENGADASKLADALTESFPTDVAAVPFLAEQGTFEEEPAWIVFEAWGEPGGKLSYRRVWVFSRQDGTVLAARSVR